MTQKRKKTFNGRWPLMKDDLWLKTTFDWRGPLMKDDLWWKTTFEGRRPSIEDDLWWKTIFDGRWPMGGVWLGEKFPFKRVFPTGRHTALDIFRFAVFVFIDTTWNSTCQCTCGQLTAPGATSTPSGNYSTLLKTPIPVICLALKQRMVATRYYFNKI